MNENQDYTNFGGWLLVWYWCLIVGGVLMVLNMVLPALLAIAASFLIGPVYAVGSLVSIASICVSAIFEIKAAIQLKARDARFFDTFLLGAFISLGGGIISNLLMIRGAFGAVGFVSSAIGSIVGAAIGLGLCIMYFSKSARVYTYFSGRPVQYSQHWSWIQKLPAFIISDTK